MHYRGTGCDSADDEYGVGLLGFSRYQPQGDTGVVFPYVSCVMGSIWLGPTWV